MLAHYCTKVKPNQFRDGTVISANVHTHSSSTQTLFLLFFMFRYLSVNYS